MVSIREIRRIFEEHAPERQLPMMAILEFQDRIELVMNEFVKLCEMEAGGNNTNSRLTANHVKLAFVKFNDNLMKEEEEEEELEFGEWNTEEGDE